MSTPQDQLTPQQMTLPDFVDKVGDRLGVPRVLRESIFQQESHWDHYRGGKVLTSPKGALGVGQLMPDTAIRLGVDALDPIDNAYGSLKEQKRLYDKYLDATGDEHKAILLAAAAYNAGEGAVDKYHGIPPYAETQNYVMQVAKAIKGISPSRSFADLPKLDNTQRQQVTAGVADAGSVSHPFARTRSYADVATNGALAPPPLTMAEAATLRPSQRAARLRQQALSPPPEAAAIAAGIGDAATNPNKSATVGNLVAGSDPNLLTALPRPVRYVAELLANGGAGIEDAAAGALEIISHAPHGMQQLPADLARRAADWLRKSATDVRGASTQKPFTGLAKVGQDVGAGAVEFAPVAAATAGAGVLPAMIGGGAYSGLQATGRGESAAGIAKSTAMGAAQFGLLGLPAASMPLKSAIGKALVKTGVVTLGSAELAKLGGASTEEAIKSGAIMGLLASPEVLASTKWFRHADLGEVAQSPDQSGVPAGKVRVLDQQGEPHTIIQPSRARNQRAVPLKSPSFSEMPDVPIGTIAAPRVVKAANVTRETLPTPDHPVAAAIVSGAIDPNVALDPPIAKEVNDAIAEARAIANESTSPTRPADSRAEINPPVADSNQAGERIGSTQGVGEVGGLSEPPTRVPGERQLPKSAVAAGLPQGADTTYEVNTDVGATERANARIAASSPQQVAAELRATAKPTKDDVVAGSIVAHDLAASGDIAGSVDVIDHLSRQLTEAGQSVQAASLIARLSPEGVLLKGQRSLPAGQKLTEEQGTELVNQAAAVRQAEAEVADATTARMAIEQPQATIKQRIGTLRDRLAVLEADARARLAARTGVNQSGGQAGASTIPLDIADYAIIGAAKLARKGINLATWTHEMIDEFGDAVKPQLSAIYRDSHKLYDEQRQQFLQEAKLRSAQRAEPTAGADELQAVINRQKDAQTAARKARSELLATFKDLNTGGLERFIKGVGDVAGLSRALQTTADLSWGFRQGKMALRHPGIWLEGFAKQKVALSEQNYQRLLSEIELDPDYKYMQRGKLELTGVGSANSGQLAQRAEGFQSKLVRKIPILKQSEMAYNAMSDWVKSRWFKARLDALRKSGVDLEAPENQRLLTLEADLINNATGRGHLPLGLDRAAPLINQLTYSARFWASRLKMLTLPLDPRMYGVSVGNSEAGAAFLRPTRVEAWKTLATYYGVVGGQMLLLKSLGFKVGIKPEDPDFLKASLGPVHLDLSAGMLNHLRFMAHITQSIVKGKSGEKVGNKQAPLDIAGTYLRSKESPNVGMIHDIFLSDKKNGYGTDFKGDVVYPFGDPHKQGLDRLGSSYLLQRHAPMVASDIIEAYKQLGWKGAAIIAPVSATGEGVSIYSKRKGLQPPPR